MQSIEHVKPGYYDPAEEAHEVFRKRRVRRNRWLCAISCWLRERSNPRRTVAMLLANSLGCGATLDWLLHRCWGLSPWGLSAAVGTLVAWGIFVLLLRRQVEAIYSQMEVAQDLPRFLDVQKPERERQDGAGRVTACREVQLDTPTHHSGSAGEGDQEREPGALIVVVIAGLFLACVTFGAFVVWSLIRSAPRVMALMLVDLYVVPAQAQLVQTVEYDPKGREWRRFVAVHFLGFLAAAMVGSWALHTLIVMFSFPR